MAELLYSEAIASARRDVCETCGTVFVLSEGCPCEHCGRKHWHEEWCLDRLFVHRRHDEVGGVDGSVHQDLRALRLRSPSATLGDFVAHAHSALRHLTRPWEWDDLDFVVGVIKRAGRIRFWVRHLEHPRVEVVRRAEMLTRLHEYVPAWALLEMVDPPAWEGL